MKNDNFTDNLKLLCSHAKSITQVCEHLSLNRQQFHRYLNGSSHPSLSNMRDICDYFGVEEHEILPEKEAFRQLISV
jgi:transcriptional regulator with XRE-family HTH domain